VEGIEEIHLVQFDLERQHLEDAEQVEHEAVARQRPLLHLELRSFLVVLENFGQVVEAGVPALRVGQEVVENSVLEIPRVLQFELEGVVEALVAGRVPGEELLGHLGFVLGEHRDREEGPQEGGAYYFAALGRCAGLQHELHLLGDEGADGARSAADVRQLEQGLDGHPVLLSHYARVLHHPVQSLEQGAEHRREQLVVGVRPGHQLGEEPPGESLLQDGRQKGRPSELVQLLVRDDVPLQEQSGEVHQLRPHLRQRVAQRRDARPLRLVPLLHADPVVAVHQVVERQVHGAVVRCVDPLHRQRRYRTAVARTGRWAQRVYAAGVGGVAVALDQVLERIVALGDLHDHLHQGVRHHVPDRRRRVALQLLAGLGEVHAALGWLLEGGMEDPENGRLKLFLRDFRQGRRRSLSGHVFFLDVGLVHLQPPPRHHTGRTKKSTRSYIIKISIYTPLCIMNQLRRKNIYNNPYLINFFNILLLASIFLF
jgi:hypothetical protein